MSDIDLKEEPRDPLSPEGIMDALQAIEGFGAVEFNVRVQLFRLVHDIIDAARREMQERCAKVCDDRAKHRSAESTTDDAVTQVLNLEAEACALRIRALEVKP